MLVCKNLGCNNISITYDYQFHDVIVSKDFKLWSRIKIDECCKNPYEIFVSEKADSSKTESCDSKYDSETKNCRAMGHSEKDSEGCNGKCSEYACHCTSNSPIPPLITNPQFSIGLKWSESTHANDQRIYSSGLSQPMYELMKLSTTGPTIYYQKCLMYNSGKGANWLSKESSIKNPYYGSIMMTFGSTVEKIN
ncbi:hypothetical protein B0E43_21085 [Algoriphagus sp. A40]|nr:hypothetical protein B0E43_21085 [Algoriphagus sp. A40]